MEETLNLIYSTSTRCRNTSEHLLSSLNHLLPFFPTQTNPDSIYFFFWRQEEIPDPPLSFSRPWLWMHCPWSSSSPLTPFSPRPAPSSSSSQQWPVPCPRPLLCCRARGCRGAPNSLLCLSRYLPPSPSHLQGARASPPWGLTSTR